MLREEFIFDLFQPSSGVIVVGIDAHQLALKVQLWRRWPLRAAQLAETFSMLQGWQLLCRSGWTVNKSTVTGLFSRELSFVHGHVRGGLRCLSLLFSRIFPGVNLCARKNTTKSIYYFQLLS